MLVVIVWYCSNSDSFVLKQSNPFGFAQREVATAVQCLWFNKSDQNLPIVRNFWQK